MRNFLALMGVYALFFFGSNIEEDRVIAQHEVYAQCFGTVHRCTEIDGQLSYTLNTLWLRIDTLVYEYRVTRYDPVEKIITVSGADLTGFVRIHEQYARFFITPRDKQRYRSTTITYRISKTLYYKDGN